MASASIRPELIERVESGEGWEGRENDQLCREIALVMGYSYKRPPPDSDRPFPSAWFDPEGRHCGFGPPNWLRSLDAVVSLIEQKLPGWGYMLSRYETPRGIRSHASVLSPPDSKHGDTFDIWAASSPRALLSACLRTISVLEGSKAARADSTNDPASSDLSSLRKGAEVPCPHAPTYDAGLCCGHPDDCTFVREGDR